MTSHEENVDWPYWTRLDLWTLNQAIYLLLRIDPDSRRARQVFHSREFTKLHDLAWASYQARILRLHQVDYDGETVSPQVWLEWATAKDLVIPDELMSLLPASGAKIIRAEPLSEDLEPGERTTLHKLAAYLARRFGYDAYAARNDATGKISQELQKHGIAIDDKTIRKLLKTGTERFPDERQKS